MTDARGRSTDLVRGGVVVAGGAVTVALPQTFPADGGPTAADRAVAAPIHSALDAHPGIYHALVIPSNGYIVLPLLVAGVAWFLYRRRWWCAATLAVVPELVVAINTLVLKPLWERPLHDYLAYPSGHTVQLVAVATAFVLLTDSRRARRITVALGAIALVLVAIGMIGLGYHLATDIAGGTAAAIAMTTALVWCAALLRAAAVRFSPARRHSRR
ncbi:phosphatase PAP2 family protein [Nocardia panacis]|uniref:Phosphatase PAP2 family protein n=1 Tax=Nocardia panacis TaxID=2340916 RepID=A0A3A4KGC2_9NOCA|nr:phosphatase PAP2 family protein [Nocardia panacis]RJO73499.1 phosphatase PAP2 family protein [Nocardia panacis]